MSYRYIQQKEPYKYESTFVAPPMELLYNIVNNREQTYNQLLGKMAETQVELGSKQMLPVDLDYKEKVLDKWLKPAFEVLNTSDNPAVISDQVYSAIVNARSDDFWKAAQMKYEDYQKYKSIYEQLKEKGNLVEGDESFLSWAGKSYYDPVTGKMNITSPDLYERPNYIDLVRNTFYGILQHQREGSWGTTAVGGIPALSRYKISGWKKGEEGLVRSLLEDESIESFINHAGQALKYDDDLLPKELIELRNKTGADSKEFKQALRQWLKNDYLPQTIIDLSTYQKDQDIRDIPTISAGSGKKNYNNLFVDLVSNNMSSGLAQTLETKLDENFNTSRMGRWFRYLGPKVDETGKSNIGLLALLGGDEQTALKVFEGLDKDTGPTLFGYTQSKLYNFLSQPRNLDKTISELVDNFNTYTNYNADKLGLSEEELHTLKGNMDLLKSVSEYGMKVSMPDKIKAVQTVAKILTKMKPKSEPIPHADEIRFIDDSNKQNNDPNFEYKLMSFNNWLHENIKKTPGSITMPMITINDFVSGNESESKYLSSTVGKVLKSENIKTYSKDDKEVIDEKGADFNVNGIGIDYLSGNLIFNVDAIYNESNSKQTRTMTVALKDIPKEMLSTSSTILNALMRLGSGPDGHLPKFIANEARHLAMLKNSNYMSKDTGMIQAKEFKFIPTSDPNGSTFKVYKGDSPITYKDLLSDKELFKGFCYAKAFELATGEGIELNNKTAIDNLAVRVGTNLSNSVNNNTLPLDAPITFDTYTGIDLFINKDIFN